MLHPTRPSRSPSTCAFASRTSKPRRTATMSAAIVSPCQRTSSSDVRPEGADFCRDGAVIVRAIAPRFASSAAVPSCSDRSPPAPWRNTTAGSRAPVLGRRDEVRLDPVVTARVRDVLHDDPVAGRASALVDVEWRALRRSPARHPTSRPPQPATTSATRAKQRSAVRRTCRGYAREHGCGSRRPGRAGSSFGAVADAYERARPGYPDERCAGSRARRPATSSISAPARAS